MKQFLIRVKQTAFIILFAGIAKNGMAQDQPHFSLYMYQPTIINPAALGSFDEINGAVYFNKQMMGFDGSPMNGFLDFGAPIGKTNAYLGFQAQVQGIGVTNKTSFGASFAYRLKLNTKHYLSLGLNFTANNIGSALSTAPTTTPGDLVFSYNASAWHPDFRLGAYYFSDNVYAGFSVGNFLTTSLRGDNSGQSSEILVDGKNMHMYIMGGWQKKIGNHWKIRPSGLVKIVPGSPLQLDINAMAVFRDAFGFGLSYRTTSTLVFNLSYTLNDFLIFGYSFNMGLAYGDRANFMGHEAMLAFRVKSSKRIAPVEIPRF